jgi:hypothetical protein
MKCSAFGEIMRRHGTPFTLSFIFLHSRNA